MIYTLNTRNNIVWNLAKEIGKLDYKAFYEEINISFEEFLRILDENRVKYEELKSALIPGHDENKKELLLCFDTTIMDDDSYYGINVLDMVFPLLDEKTVNSIFMGDYILENKYQERGKEIFDVCLKKVNNTSWLYSNQYFFVYINNITANRYKVILEGLKRYPEFIGYMDASYESELKSLMAYMLTPVGIKYKKSFLVPSVLDYGNDSFYPFEDRGYRVINISDVYYYSFLEYKIPSSLLDYEDVVNSFNAISEIGINLESVNVIIEEKKLNHLKTEKNKAKILKRSGLVDFGVSELTELLKFNLFNNYIFNLKIMEYGISFNIIFEVYANKKRYRILASFEYIPEDNSVRLITLY